MLKAILGFLNAYKICRNKMLFLRVSVDFNACAVETRGVSKAPNSGVRKIAAFCERDFSICMEGYDSERFKDNLVPLSLELIYAMN